MDTKKLNETLESLVDKHGLLEIVVALELICMDKADHIATNWDDKPLEKAWRKADSAFHNLAVQIQNGGVLQ